MRSYAWARRFPASCPCLGKCLNLALPRPSNFLVPVLSIPVTVREAQEASLWLPRGVSKKKLKGKKLPQSGRTSRRSGLRIRALTPKRELNRLCCAWLGLLLIDTRVLGITTNR